MNIVEAYVKFNDQMIIIITGISGCGKSALAKNISNLFKMQRLDQHNYYKKDWDKKETLADGTEIIDYDTDDAIDWERYNDDINKLKEKGVIVSGVSHPSERLKFKPDYHIHLNISKQACIDRRKEFFTKNKEEYPEDSELLEKPAEKLKFNRFTFPYYLETSKKGNVNKFFNITDKSDEEVFDEIFEYLMVSIQKALNQPERIRENKRVEPKKRTVLAKKARYEIEAELMNEAKPMYDDELDMIEKYAESVSDTTPSSDLDESSPLESEDDNVKKKSSNRIMFMYPKY